MATNEARRAIQTRAEQQRRAAARADAVTRCLPDLALCFAASLIATAVAAHLIALNPLLWPWGTAGLLGLKVASEMRRRGPGTAGLVVVALFAWFQLLFFVLALGLGANAFIAFVGAVAYIPPVIAIAHCLRAGGTSAARRTD